MANTNASPKKTFSKLVEALDLAGFRNHSFPNVESGDALNLSSTSAPPTCTVNSPLPKVEFARNKQEVDGTEEIVIFCDLAEPNNADESFLDTSPSSPSHEEISNTRPTEPKPLPRSRLSTWLDGLYEDIDLLHSLEDSRTRPSLFAVFKTDAVVPDELDNSQLNILKTAPQPTLKVEQSQSRDLGFVFGFSSPSLDTSSSSSSADPAMESPRSATFTSLLDLIGIISVIDEHAYSPDEESPAMSSPSVKLEQLHPSRAVSPRPVSPRMREAAPAQSRMPLEEKSHKDMTLFDRQCSIKCQDIKRLTAGQIFEIRTNIEARPYARIYERTMLHFCGKQMVKELLQIYCVGELEGKEEDGKKREPTSVLVIPEDDFLPSAMGRVLRYMRRCMLPMSSRPLYQIVVPPSPKEQLHTMNVCRLFGLEADADRIEKVLIRQTISHGPLTMEDVELVWEGWEGVLQDSRIVDALVCYILYNVVGKDTDDAAEIRMLLEEDEYKELREVVSEELGTKTCRGEPKFLFMKRKGKERLKEEERWYRQRANANVDVDSKGEWRDDEVGDQRVSNRLLKILSNDALDVKDPSASTRYKRPLRSLLKRNTLDNLLTTDAEMEDRTGGPANDEELPIDQALQSTSSSVYSRPSRELLADPIPDVLEDRTVRSDLHHLKAPRPLSERTPIYSSITTPVGTSQPMEGRSGSGHSRTADLNVRDAASRLTSPSFDSAVRRPSGPKSVSSKQTEATRRVVSTLMSLVPNPPAFKNVDDAPVAATWSAPSRFRRDPREDSQSVAKAKRSPARRPRAFEGVALPSPPPIASQKEVFTSRASPDKRLPSLPGVTKQPRMPPLPPSEPLMQRTMRESTQGERRSRPVPANITATVLRGSRFEPTRPAPQPRQAESVSNRGSPSSSVSRTEPCPTCGRSSPKKRHRVDSIKSRGSVYLKDAWEKVQGKR
jgi:hypothetical protein